MADSWLLDGNCDTCRRQKYCKKECKLHVQRERAAFTGKVLSVATAMMGKMLDKGDES